MRVFHLLQQPGKIRRSQIKRFTEDHRKISAALLNPFLDSIAVVHTVVGVFQRQRHLQSLAKLPRVHERPQKFCGRVPQQIHWAERPKDPLVSPVENARRRSSGGNPRSLVTVRHHRLRLAQCRGIASQHRHHVVRAHRAFSKSSGFCLVRSIVIKHLSQRQFLVQFANEYSTLFINLLDRQLDPFFLELTRLGLTSGQRQHHAHGNIFGSHSRRIARCVRCSEPCKQQSHQS